MLRAAATGHVGGPDGAGGGHGVRRGCSPGLALATSRSAGSGSLLPLAAGPQHRFPAGPRGAWREGAVPRRSWGHPGSCLASPSRGQDEWTRGARPERKQTPPARPAKRAGTGPAVCPGPPGFPAVPGAERPAGPPARASSGTGCFRVSCPYCKPPAGVLLVSLFVDGS